MELSPLTKKLIEEYKAAKQSESPAQRVPLIHVDEVALKVASFYENIRTVVEWKEEHLMRKAAIVRKLNRMLPDLDANFTAYDTLAESLVIELIRGGHFPNDKIPQSKVLEVSKVIKKYIFLLKHNTARPTKYTLQFSHWLVEVAAYEVEDALSPAIREKALIEHMFWTMKERVHISEKVYEKKILQQGDEDIQLYIACCQALFSLDTSIISYNLLKYKYPLWEQADEALISEVSERIFAIFQEINNDFSNPLSHKFYALCERYDTPHLLLGDVLSAENSENVEEEISNPSRLEEKIKQAYKKRLSQLDGKIFRAAFYLTLSIFITKILLLVALESIITFATQNAIHPGILVADVLIPTFLMFTIASTAKKPSKKNLNVALLETMKITYQNKHPETHEIKPTRKRGFTVSAVVSFLYSISFVVTIGLIWGALSYFEFPVTSIIIDIVFIALILFAGSSIRKKAQELTVEEEKEGIFHFLSDIFFLPLQGFGKWLSNTWKQYNAVAAIFNALIDIPFASFIEFLEGWRHFLKERKEEIR